jgi:hypothetical protein
MRVAALSDATKEATGVAGDAPPATRSTIAEPQMTPAAPAT